MTRTRYIPGTEISVHNHTGHTQAMHYNTHTYESTVQRKYYRKQINCGPLRTNPKTAPKTIIKLALSTVYEQGELPAVRVAGGIMYVALVIPCIVTRDTNLYTYTRTNSPLITQCSLLQSSLLSCIFLSDVQKWVNQRNTRQKQYDSEVSQPAATPRYRMC